MKLLLAALVLCCAMVGCPGSGYREASDAKIGSLVRPRCGGPVMVVKCYTDLGGDLVVCKYLAADGVSYREEVFPLSGLVLVASDASSVPLTAEKNKIAEVK